MNLCLQKCHTKSLIFFDEKYEKSGFLKLFYDRYTMLFDTFGVPGAILKRPTSISKLIQHR